MSKMTLTNEQNERLRNIAEQALRLRRLSHQPDAISVAQDYEFLLGLVEASQKLDPGEIRTPDGVFKIVDQEDVKKSDPPQEGLSITAHLSEDRDCWQVILVTDGTAYTYLIGCGRPARGIAEELVRRINHPAIRRGMEQ